MPSNASLRVRKVVLKGQFERDWRRWIAGHSEKADVQGVMEMLASGMRLDPRYRDHPLKGRWKGCRDCHVRGDLVLIYSLPPGLAVFHRVGSHSELFG